MSNDVISLKVEAREVTGKAVKHLRRDGIVPAVIHDHGKPSISVEGDYMQMLKVYREAGKHHPIALTANGKKYTTIIRSATFEPKKNTLTHLVFNAVSRNEKVEAEIPVKPKYADDNESSPAERAGLLVLEHADMVKVEAIASNLPDVLYYDAEKLVEVGDNLKIGDLLLPDGVELKSDPETSLASVYEPSAVAAANDAAGGDAEEADAEEVEAENGEDSTDDESASDAEQTADKS